MVAPEEICWSEDEGEGKGEGEEEGEGEESVTSDGGYLPV